MGKLLEQLKSLPRIAESGLSKIVEVDFDQKAVVCKNKIHMSPPDLHGNTHLMKMILTFGRELEIRCEGCNTIYKKIRPF